MSHGKPSLSIVVPVYEESEESIRKLKATCPKDWEVLVVDDGSRHIHTQADIVHLGNRGYGQAIKTGIRQARADLVATMDGDGQHNFRDIKRLYEFIDYFPHLAMVVGDRRVRETNLKRWMGRKGLNWIATLFANRWIPDLNSGLRIFRKKVALGYEPILCDGFSYTTSLTMSMLCDGYPIDWLPIKVHPRRYGQSKVSLMWDGITTLKYILVIGLALRTRTLRRWLRERG